MKRATFIVLMLSLVSSYQHTYPVLATVGHYKEHCPPNLYRPINPDVLKWQEKYYKLRIQYTQFLHEISQKNKTAWSCFAIEIHQLNEKNKRTLSRIEKEHTKKLNHERWFQNFLYTSLFTFGIITYKTCINKF